MIGKGPLLAANNTTGIGSGQSAATPASASAFDGPNVWFTAGEKGAGEKGSWWASPDFTDT
jgi:hypothetical protein